MSHPPATGRATLPGARRVGRSLRVRPSRELRLDVFRVAIRADAVAELGREVLLDVFLERLPHVAVVTNALEVGADGEQPLELLQLGAQAQDALRDGEPGAQLVRVDRLADEVVRPRLHPGEILLL